MRGVRESEKGRFCHTFSGFCVNRLTLAFLRCLSPLSVTSICLQAKFYAPDSMQKFVSARSGERAVVDLPDNGME